jgi:hypothetical protein
MEDKPRVGKYGLLQRISLGMRWRGLEKLCVRKKKFFFSTKSPDRHRIASGSIFENRKLYLIISSVGLYQKVVPHSVAHIQQRRSFDFV